jgi:sec-independent protein translocase protein TatA
MIFKLLLLAFILLLVFGAGRVTKLGQGLGEGIRNFRKGLKADPDPAAPKPLDRRSQD